MKARIATALLLAIAMMGLHPPIDVLAADHRESPRLFALADVVFEGKVPEFDADGKISSASPVTFSAIGPDGSNLSGSGVLQFYGDVLFDPGWFTERGRIDDILGVRDIADGAANTIAFTGKAEVRFDSVEINGDSFIAVGAMRLRAMLTEPDDIQRYVVEGEAVRGEDGFWSARFRGQDSFGVGVGIDGSFLPDRRRGIWDDTDIVHLGGEVEALGIGGGIYNDTDLTLIDPATPPGAEDLLFVYDGIGRLSLLEATRDAPGRVRFLAELKLASSPGHGVGVRIGFIEVTEVVRSQSQEGSDGRVRGRASVIFDLDYAGGIKPAGSELTGGTSQGAGEYRYVGEAIEGNEWFMSRGQLIITDDLVIKGPGGSVSSVIPGGQKIRARIVGTVDASGGINLRGGLGEVRIVLRQ